MPGFGLGISSLVEVMVVFALIGAAWTWRKGTLGVTLVLREFRVSRTPNTPTVIRIVGRISGVVNWLLTLLRLKPEVEFEVTQEAVSIRYSSLSGFRQFYVPVEHVCCTECGYQRSVMALVFAALFSVGFLFNLLSGILSAFADRRSEASSDITIALGFLILDAIAAALYYFSKRIVLSIETESGGRQGVLFKRSVMENVSVDLPQALQAMGMLNALILSRTQHRQPSEYAPSMSAMPDHTPRACLRCGALIPVGSRFCEGCGSPIMA